MDDDQKIEKARGILRETAKRLEDEYERPPDPEGTLVEEKFSVITVYVSNVSHVSNVSRSANQLRKILGKPTEKYMNTGEWAIIEYAEGEDFISVMYDRGGVAGVSDKVERLQFEDADPEKIENIVNGYL